MTTFDEWAENHPPRRRGTPCSTAAWFAELGALDGGQQMAHDFWEAMMARTDGGYVHSSSRVAAVFADVTARKQMQASAPNMERITRHRLGGCAACAERQPA